MKKGILILLNSSEKYELLHNHLITLGYTSADIHWHRNIDDAVNTLPEPTIVLFDIAGNANPAADIERLKRQFVGIPVIALVSGDALECEAEAIRSGAQESLNYKALDPASLSRAITLARERKLQTLKLRSILDDYMRHFDNGPIPMCIVSTDTLKFIGVNNAAVEKYGYTKEEFANLTLRDIRPQEDIAPMLESIGHRDTVYSDAGYWRHKKKNGEVFWVHIYSHATTFDGVPARLSFVVDVDEKVLAEKQRKELHDLVKEQKETLDSILSTINDAIWSRRADDNELIYANNAYYKLYDTTPQEVNRENDFILNDVYPEDRAIFLGAMENVRKDGKTEIIYRYHHKDGTLRTLKASAIYHKGVNGKIDTIDGVTIDISREKELYDAIRNSEHKLLSTINNTKDLIWTVDRELKIIFCNKPYQDYFYDLAGVVLEEGDYALGSWHSEDFINHRKKEYERSLNGESFSTVIEEHHKDQVRYNELSSNPVFDHQGKIIGVNCICRDVTEQRMQLMKIQQQNEMLKEIAWIQSHKVRGPVASILGLISLMKPEEDPHNAEIINLLRSATDELDNIIREVVAKTNNIEYSYTYLPALKTGV